MPSGNPFEFTKNSELLLFSDRTDQSTKVSGVGRSVDFSKLQKKVINQNSSFLTSLEEEPTHRSINF